MHRIKKVKGRVPIVCMCVHTRLQGISVTIRIQWKEGEDVKKLGVFGE